MEIDENPKTIAILNRLDKVIGINEDFVQDIIFILKQYQENVFVMDVLDKFVSNSFDSVLDTVGDIKLFVIINKKKFMRKSLIVFFLYVWNANREFSQTEAIETKMEAHRHKIDACILREYSKNITEEKLLGDITMLENVLSIYLPPEITSGILNLMRASCPCAPYYQIESALVSYNDLKMSDLSDYYQCLFMRINVFFFRIISMGLRTKLQMSYWMAKYRQVNKNIFCVKIIRRLLDVECWLSMNIIFVDLFSEATIKKHEDCSSSILDLLRTVEYIRIDVLNDFKTFAQSFCFYNSFIVRFFDKVVKEFILKLLHKILIEMLRSNGFILLKGIKIG